MYSKNSVLFRQDLIEYKKKIFSLQKHDFTKNFKKLFYKFSSFN